jgi:hypothetical protein
MSGRNDDADRFADAALDVLAPFADSPELAMAYSTLSQLRMLAYRADEAIEWGERAISIASARGHSEILVHAMTNVGAVKLLKFDEEGRVLLERALALAVQHGLEDDAARPGSSSRGRVWSSVSSRPPASILTRDWPIRLNTIFW